MEPVDIKLIKANIYIFLSVRLSFHGLLWSKESGCAGRLQNKHLFIIQTN